MNSFYVYSKIRLQDFPDLVSLHLEVVKGTRELEKKGQILIATGFPPDSLQVFIETVHSWGGTFRNLSKVMQNAKPSQFASAWKALTQDPPMVGRALDFLIEINGLGISYGSKHLRFLCPQFCPVLDNQVWDSFRYSWDSKGYRQYHQETMQVVKLLEAYQISNPMERPVGKWFAGDVDMAIFASLQREKHKSGWI